MLTIRFRKNWSNSSEMWVWPQLLLSHGGIAMKIENLSIQKCNIYLQRVLLNPWRAQVVVTRSESHKKRLNLKARKLLTKKVLF